MKKDNLTVLKYTKQLQVLYTIIRDKETQREQFRFYSDRIIRLLIEEALDQIPVEKKEIETPTRSKFSGSEFKYKICAVSIMRAGEAMEEGIKEVCKGIRIGKILIQRNEETALPKLYYAKLPPDIEKRYVFLLDPMLATGGSAYEAIKVLKEKGVPENKIIFVNLISCPEGINKIQSNYPNIKIVTGFIDEKLNNKAYILPGLGDFGDRYFGTE